MDTHREVRRDQFGRTAVAGPLAPFADGWRQELARRGFAPHSITSHARLVAHLSGWMVVTGRVLADLTDDAAQEYLRARRGAGYTNRTTGRALVPLLGYLRDLGVVPEPGAQASATPMEILLAEFETFLVNERGLAAGSVDHYLRFARVFLAALGPVPLDAALAGLSAGTVTSFVTTQMRWRSAGDGRGLVTALRSLLRFLHVTGHVPDAVASAVPSVPGWRCGSLPRGVKGDHVAAILTSCDRDSAQGRRDYAILILLARLGLRAGEVIKIILDDVGWRAGQLRVVGKGDRAEVLPPPADVGQALADHVQHGRPRCESRSLFITLRAPLAGLALGTCISGVVQRACVRAGVCARHSGRGHRRTRPDDVRSIDGAPHERSLHAAQRSMTGRQPGQRQNRAATARRQTCVPACSWPSAYPFPRPPSGYLKNTRLT